jgi:lipopolysaccharide export system protein LptA
MDQLSAETLVLDLDSSFRAKHLVATGHPQFRDADVQGPILLNGDEIAAALRANGLIESIVATGSVHGSRNTTMGEDKIEAQRMQMNFAPAQNVPRLLTASGGVVLTSTGSTTAAGTRRVDSQALEIHFASDSRGGTTPGPARLESINTLAPARVEWQSVSTAGGKPVPQITRMNGKHMNLRFDGQNQLQQLVSSGGVEVNRRIGDAPEQTTTSRELNVKFSGSGEWSAVDQMGNVRFQEGVRSGQADSAHLDRATNTTTLNGSVVLVDSSTRTTAQSAIFTQSSNELRADGKVISTALRGGAGNLSNLADEPAHVSADHLVADTARGHAVYSGKGRLWQGQSVIEGDTIELDSPSHVVVARGHVRGVFPQAAWSPKPGPAAIQPSAQATDVGAEHVPTRTAGRPMHPADHPEPDLGHVRGGLLTYWDTESRARVEQDAHVDSSQGSIQANQIDLYFSTPDVVNGTRQLARSVAIGDVTVHQEDRRGTSNKAEYTASEGKFVLSEGKPTVYDSDGDTTTGRQLTFYFSDDRIVVDSEAGSKTVTLHRVEK